MTTGSQRRPIRMLVVTSLYPNAAQPQHGVFVEQRLLNLLASGEVEARVIAPVPWFFSRSARFGRYAEFAAVPRYEVRHGVPIWHPRYIVIPRVGMTLGPASMAHALRRAVRAMRATGYDFDLIDAHYFYPDGVAAARLGRHLDRPVVITARGTDVNQIAGQRMPRSQILKAADNAAAVITVSQALHRELARLGVAPDKLLTLRNGVDFERFAPVAQREARARLALTGPVWLTVGRLIELKGLHVAIAALAQVPDVTLVAVGKGPALGRLQEQARQLGVADRVHFVGELAHDALIDYYAAADALVHPAGREGMPNVVLEAMACGLAVIATAVGGIPEVLDRPIAGHLMSERSAHALIEAWQRVRTQGLDQPRRAERRRNALRFSWDETTRGQLDLFTKLVERSTYAKPVGSAPHRGRTGTMARRGL